jgi:hypothetical protein
LNVEDSITAIASDSIFKRVIVALKPGFVISLALETTNVPRFTLDKAKQISKDEEISDDSLPRAATPGVEQSDARRTSPTSGGKNTKEATSKRNGNAPSPGVTKDLNLIMIEEMKRDVILQWLFEVINNV